MEKEKGKVIGFQTMEPQRLKELASIGGKRAHALRKAHVWSVEEARKAGAKGGRKTAQNRQHMVDISKKAQENRKAKAAQAQAESQETAEAVVPETAKAV